MSFLSEYDHTLDDKDRLTVPSKYRAFLEGGLVLTKGLDGQIAVYPDAEFETHVAAMLQGVDTRTTRGRTFQRYLFGNAYRDSLDSAGRIRLPRAYVEHAGLEGTATIRGVQNYFEVWNPQRLADNQDAEDIASIAESFANPPAS